MEKEYVHLIVTHESRATVARVHEVTRFVHARLQVVDISTCLSSRAFASGRHFDNVLFISFFLSFFPFSIWFVHVARGEQTLVLILYFCKLDARIIMYPTRYVLMHISVAIFLLEPNLSFFSKIPVMRCSPCNLYFLSSL
jgi:hypothetical protein